MDAVVLPVPDGLLVPSSAGWPFVAVCTLAEVPPGTMRRITRGDYDLLVIHSERGLCLIDDRCPHMAAPLSLGGLDGCVVACPLHRGTFDLSTGNVIQFPTTGGLDADGVYHPTWQPTGTLAKEQPSDTKARARALTRVRRIRYYPLRVVNGVIEARLPA
ncbi:MAG TPA: Rieske 2Fe-2S domain-containing protein [Candidatus Limnocylindrales bacterium]|nr:Rieske 2Fe-2S domain-containing protein [Candidatus Limnocylindrales bacterium]